MPPKPNSTRRVLVASLAGTAIEFFDFYIYAMASVLVFPTLFFTSSDPASATLKSLATFAVAFVARPVGSAVFGHYGDRVGRKATLVAALLTMGVSTVAIGLLPTHAAIGTLAPLLLILCRFGQGFGLGGEWGGAVLLATENAPPGQRAWYGMFPQLGAPLGFICSGGIFLLVSGTGKDSQFLDYGWRIPFIASSLLVLVGLYVRLRITETPVFQEAMDKKERVAIPFLKVFRSHAKAVALGTLTALATFVLFYLLTVFCLFWGTKRLGYTSHQFLLIQMAGILFFALTIPYSAVLADRHGRRLTLMWVTVAIAAFGLAFGPLFSLGLPGVLTVMIVGFLLTGMTYGPLGTMLAELFPTAVRYTGASLSFNFAGILGGSVAPYFATELADNFGLRAVGWYLTGAAVLSFAALWLSRGLAENVERGPASAGLSSLRAAGPS
jgi:metabolite-proton symporter